MAYWNLIDNYFSKNRYNITKHHLDSYNYFISHGIKKTIKSMNPFIILKKDPTNTSINKHIIEIYIGGENGDEIFIDKPILFDKGDTRMMLPNESRINSLTYSSSIYCNVIVKYINHCDNKPIIEKLEHVLIGSIPIMLHSKLCYLNNMNNETLREMGECYYDRGGYFIVDGKEKVIVAQERNSTNNLFITEYENDPKYSHKSFIHCFSETSSVFSKTIRFNVLNSSKRKNSIVVKIPHIETEIPIFILFRAIGIESDNSIIKYILNDTSDSVELDLLRDSLIDSSFIYSTKHAKEYLANFVALKSVEHVEYILVNNLLPNYEHEEEVVNFNTKALFLGNLVKQLLNVMSGKYQPTDRDNYMHKRVGISGFLLNDIFKDFYNSFRVKCRSTVDSLYEYGNWTGEEKLFKKINNTNVSNIFKSSVITSGMKKSLKGSWGLLNSPSDQGIVQDVNRISYMSFISHLRRVTSTMDSSIKIRSPHQLNTSQFGYMCPCESPDGANIGLIKNFAMLCHITFNVPTETILQAIKVFEISYIKDMGKNIPNGFYIYINNNWIGNIRDTSAFTLVEYLRLLRRNALLNVFISVSFDPRKKIINIFTDAGRCCRPLVIINPKNKKIEVDDSNWYNILNGKSIKNESFDIYSTNFIDPFELFNSNSLEIVMNKLRINSSSVEFVDIYETNNCFISMYPTESAFLEDSNYTHCEIHPTTMFSVYTACIPLSNHNQAPRNIFSGAQGKQAIGVYATNFNNRIDTLGLLLNYPEKPLVQTRYNSLLNINDLPNGNNVIVAVAAYMGYNQEDSIIFNKRSIERGLFNISYFYSHLSKESTSNMTEEKVIFANPKDMISKGYNVEIKKFANYDKLDKDGLPMLNERIVEGDVVIGKCEITSQNDKNNTDNLFDDTPKHTLYVSKPEIADKTTKGVIDKVYVFPDERGEKNVKINLRKFKLPEMGDKLASRHGQKGVIGMILSEEDMPRTSSGIVPDIIMNPHAFPSRMTIGHLLECIISKGCIINGHTADMTPFDNNDFEYYYETLEKNGYDRHGEEILYNGVTGEQILTSIFFGPTYYYRLKHMVDDKINYRAPGKVTSMTRQPTKGRSNEGGLRVGEMEANCILAHGLSGFIKESFNERSDMYTFNIDNKTGLIADINESKQLYNGFTDVSKIFAPYTSKLFIQEMNTMSINMKFKTDYETIEEADERDFNDDIMYEDEGESDGQEILED